VQESRHTRASSAPHNFTDSYRRRACGLEAPRPARSSSRARKAPVRRPPPRQPATGPARPGGRRRRAVPRRSRAPAVPWEPPDLDPDLGRGSHHVGHHISQHGHHVAVVGNESRLSVVREALVEVARYVVGLRPEDGATSSTRSKTPTMTCL